MRFTRRTLIVAACAGIVQRAAAQTPEPSPATTDCLSATATPGGDHGGMHAGGGDVDIDRLYIDMMIPHHKSIIALATEAKPVLSDERLVTLAGNVLESQGAEVTRLEDLREAWYGSREIDMLSDDEMMTIMGDDMSCMNMPHDQMMDLMDGDKLVASFHAADDKDLAFIDLTIPHHEMAVLASRVAVTQAEHEELRTITQGVIDSQSKEIEELKEIREELS